MVPFQACDSDIDALIDRIGVHTGFVEPVELLMQQPSLLDMFVPDKNFLDMLAPSQIHIWFKTKGQDKDTVTNTGCGVGDPLADLS